MNKLDIQNVPKLKESPLFKGMKQSLKNPKKFDIIEEKLQAILKTSHTHPTIRSYDKCAECTRKRNRRGLMLIELGFTSFAQYIEWRKIMLIIKHKQNFQVR